MRNPLGRLQTVGAKIIWIVALISGISVVTASLAAGVRGYTHLRQQMVESITAQALIVASNASAPLSFRDVEMATSALSALKVVKEIDNARLIDNAGRPFASFTVPGHARPTGQRYPPGNWPDGDDGHVLVVPVSDLAGDHGLLQVRYNDHRLAREATTLALQSALLSIGAVLLAWVLARGLRSVLTEPVTELERATRQVRDTGDYAVRARRISNDELGHLTDAFNDMLERIQASQQALQQAQLRAEESSRLKDEFVATVSHELRTPLSPILAWIQILRLPRGAAELPKGLDVMERNAKVLIRIIEDLLDMSRIVVGNLRLDVQAVDLDAIVRAAEETLAHAASSRQVRVSLHLASPPIALRGDPARLQQVVWNLLSNAIKFSPVGGEVMLSTQRIGGQAQIVVEDRGIGLEPGFQPFAFDRFRQEDGSITRAHGGLGLGLSIVRQIVELHGGTVSVESAGRGCGSRFVVCIPIAENFRADAPAIPQRAVATGAPPGAGMLEGVRALVVEDHPDMRAIIRDVLEAAGATIIECDSAIEAMATVGAMPVDVLVSDIGLPDMDGYQLLGRLRGLMASTAGPLPAVALTAYARPEEHRRALEAGYQVHLSKPVEPDALVAAVATAMNMARN